MHPKYSQQMTDSVNSNTIQQSDLVYQDGQHTSRSCANNSKQLALQKKITSNKVRKSLLSRVSKFQFLCRKAQLPCTKVLCLNHMLSFYEIRPYTRTLRKTDLIVIFPKCPW